MKKNYTKFLAIAFAIFSIKVTAQCSSCTTTISGADASSHTVLSGQTLCIAPTGSVSGNITVSAGGTLCNQGTVNSSMVWVAGGTYNNYGTQTTDLMTVSNSGAFYNHGNVTIDSLLITGLGSSFNNMAAAALTGVRMSTVVNAVVYNFGTITENFMADSVGTFTNGGNITVAFDFGTGYSSSFTNTTTGTLNVNRDLGNAYGSTTFTNNGNLTVGRDFYNSNSASFTNNQYWNIGRDFYNSLAGVVTTNCMAIVGRDWYNSADVFGAANPSCGGFNIAGMSLNSGTIGNSSTHIDLCDAGHPVGGMDGNSGTIAVTTTYCTCANACALVGIQEIAATDNAIVVYPNPANSVLKVELNKESSIEIYSITGKLIEKFYDKKSYSIDISNYASGMYFIKAKNSFTKFIKE
jgi:hypothetical protein